MEIRYKAIYKRILGMLLYPQKIWPIAWKEHAGIQKIMRAYFLPISFGSAILTLLIGLLSFSLLQTIGIAIITFASSVAGTWLAYLLLREYLHGKLNYNITNTAALTSYSASIFIIFHNIGVAFGNIFIGQLFIIASFIFIRTLQSGINSMPDIDSKQKTNILIIATLSIICFPIIIEQILTIILGLSAINI